MKKTIYNPQNEIMKESGKWIYQILIVLLAVLIIDFNCSNRRAPQEIGHQIVLINLILGALLFVLLIFQINKRRL